MIESEQSHSCFADLGQGYYVSPFQCEVVFPSIAPWIEKPNRMVCVVKNRRDISAFRIVAESACVGEIIGVVCASVLQADDVFYLTSVKGVALMNMAVLTTVTCALSNKSSDLWGDSAPHAFLIISCAFAFAMRNRCSSTR